ncbi:MAG: hypothetical protein QHH18_07620 [Candidatus Bathyarchaeota archaeon]|jgi:16S rRNA (guanine(1405)-N(7))-methyltransferase|nr:hypothetical protein [Candidatus Bathyarchaeota archaeon A05DMB-5]MDH7558448.1 hypothetical protein [Candidatus Bathyarchaeota archaeon]
MQIPEEIVKVTIQLIQKTYKVPDDLIAQVFVAEANRDSDFISFLKEKEDYSEFQRVSAYRNLIKKVKRRLYYRLRRYDTLEAQNREGILNKLRLTIEEYGLWSPQSFELHREILKTHVSTRERLEVASDLFHSIFRITGKPQKLLDISCGLNPLFVPWMQIQECIYVCTELHDNLCNFINSYLKIVSPILNIQAHVLKLDLLELFDSENKRIVFETNPLLADCSGAFLFKVLRSMERRRKGIAKQILQWTPAEWIVVSEATRSLVKREDIRRREKIWLKRLFTQLNYSVKEFLDYPDEIIFIIEK